MSLGDVPRPHLYPSLKSAIARDAKRFRALGLVQYQGEIMFAEWDRIGPIGYVPILRPWVIAPWYEDHPALQRIYK